LTGDILGNGCINDTVQGTSVYVQFQHEQNLIPTAAKPKNLDDAVQEMNSYLGYVSFLML
jgi:hypothetical protein